jgi:ABC-type uncharacterized transport system substrate-binding protein
MKPFRNLIPTLLLFGGCSLFAGDYDTLFQTIKANWPERKTAVVACNLEMSRFAVADLLEAAKKAGITVQAINTKTDKDVDTTRGVLNKMRPDFLVLVDSDPVLGTQSKETKSLISNSLNIGIPTVGINADFLKSGGALAVGPKTDGKVIANTRNIKALRLKVPDGSTLQ